MGSWRVGGRVEEEKKKNHSASMKLGRLSWLGACYFCYWFPSLRALSFIYPSVSIHPFLHPSLRHSGRTCKHSFIREPDIPDYVTSPITWHPRLRDQITFSRHIISVSGGCWTLLSNKWVVNPVSHVFKRLPNQVDLYGPILIVIVNYVPSI